jgi:hypothetical protein
MNRSAYTTDIRILPQARLGSLGRSLRERVNVLANTPKMIHIGLVVRSSSKTTISQTYFPG